MNAEGEPPAAAELRLRDLVATSDPVDLIARIVSMERRQVTRQSDGSRRPLISGLLSDGTASVRFTWWDPPAEGIDRGMVVRAVHAEVREFRGRPEVTFTWKTRVGPASPAELPRLSLEEMPIRRVAELRPPEEGFRIEARVVRVAPRSVSVGEERRVVFEGLLADRSGTVALTAWADFGLVEGASIRIAGARVGAFRGRPQLVLDEGTTVTRIENAELPEPAEILRASPRSIAQVEETGGGESVAVEGLVVALLPPSGLVYRCPTCRRSITSGICRIHGEVDGVADLRARIVLDDGTGALTVAADRETTEQLWGVSLSEALRRLREQPDPTLLEEKLLEALFGRRLRVRGSATSDDFGLTLRPDSVETVDIDLSTTTEELAARIGPRE